MVALLSSCGGGGGHDLRVDLRTDLLPGVEFAVARAELVDVGRQDEIAALRGQRFLDGVRVATFADLPNGERDVRVRLLDSAGALVVERRVLLRQTGDHGITVLVTRDCRGLACPGSDDDPRATTCLGGRCVDPRCLEDESACPAAECATDAECGADVPCARGSCERGVCVVVAEADRCEAAQYCDPDDGCVSEGPPDAGVDAGDPDAGGPDAGDPDAGAGCLTGPGPILSHAFAAATLSGEEVVRLPDLAPRLPDYALVREAAVGTLTIVDDDGVFDGSAVIETSAAEGAELFDLLMAANALSFELWVRDGGESGSRAPGALTGAFFMIRNHPSEASFRIGLREVRASEGLPGDGDWHHLVGTYDGATGEHAVYADGDRQVNRTRTAEGFSEWTRDLNFYKLGGGTVNYTGRITRAALYDRVLAADEVACLFRGGRLGSVASP